MAETSSIEWTDATWNPVTGCALVSEGCRHCYAARLAATRLKNHPSRAGLARLNAAGEAKFTGEVRLNEGWLDQPLRWKRPRRIFVCAHGDLFHEHVPDEWIDRVFAVMALAPRHTFQVLTKRPWRMWDYMRTVARQRWRIYDPVCDHAVNVGGVVLLAEGADPAAAPPGPKVHLGTWPLRNVWLGTSVEDQAMADARIPPLLDTPAAVRFLSAEPLLRPVRLDRIPSPDELAPSTMDALTGRCWPNFTGIPYNKRKPPLDWIIAGGESGPGARPMHPDWPRALRDQCAAAGVPFFFKQWGEWEASLDRDRYDPDWRADYTNDYADLGKSRWLNLAGGRGFHGDRFHVMHRVGKSRAGRLLDGRTHDAMPGDAP